MRENKFIVKSMNTFNKLKEIETVSRRSRPRSNNTQKINSQCRWRASHSEVWLHWAGHRIISITKCDTSRLLVGKRYHFPDNIVSNYVMDRLDRICKEESNVHCCQKFFDGGVLSHNCCQMCIIAKLKKKASLRQTLEISKFCYFN